MSFACCREIDSDDQGRKTWPRHHKFLSCTKNPQNANQDLPNALVFSPGPSAQCRQNSVFFFPRAPQPSSDLTGRAWTPKRYRICLSSPQTLLDSAQLTRKLGNSHCGAE